MISPAPLTSTPIHRRAYAVDVYRERGDLMRLRGTVRDDKPAGLHFAGDPDPLTIHHMVVDLLVDVPSLTVVDVDVVFETHPHGHCPQIIGTYDQLVGLSILRGYSRAVRDLFGGPRGCTHTNALLQAMGPVVVQSMWSMDVIDRQSVDGVELARDEPAGASPRWRGTVDTCHVWAADGEVVAAMEAGGALVAPRPFRERAAALGVAEAEWRTQFER